MDTEAILAQRRAALRPAYEASHYLVYLPEQVLELRVGKCQPVADELLATWGAAHWAFLTAWNPQSQLLTRQDNEQRQQRLLKDLYKEEGVARIFPGLGIGDTGQWPGEDSLWIVGLPQTALYTLGRRYGQLACLWGEIGQAAQLLWF